MLEDSAEPTLGPSVIFSSNAEFSETEHFLSETSPLRQATLLQPTPFLKVRVPIAESPPPVSAATGLTSQLFSDPRLQRSVLRQAKTGVNSLSADLVRGEEAAPLVTTDVGSLLGKSRGALSVQTQKRTPVVNDPRIRSSRIGSLAASGSYWVPAREDLDTALSKIDSRLISDVVVVPGPYSSVYGPGFSFVDFELLQSPRFSDGFSLRADTSVNHQSNGNQWLGQQSLVAGGETWGIRGNYTHRLGSDYRAGDGSPVAASYESREFTVALGRDFRNHTS
ncbi:MAG: hypothetical protein MI861_22830, partial [Pirellulales bacterium]|nr:hypothetical protein [Pirellulales bacterium]